VISRRNLFAGAGLGALLPAFGRRAGASSTAPAPHTDSVARPRTYTPVVCPDSSRLPWRMVDGFKEYHLVAEEVEQELAPGSRMRCWGYNGATPGPTIEAVAGDRVRFLVTNRLPEHTTVHWHGIRMPCGMDGAGGITQPHIPPGETWAYEMTLPDAGTFLYHPHADEMVQMALGMMGMIVVHPKDPSQRARVDRDFVILLHEWLLPPGTYRPDPSEMLDFNHFTFNGKVFPGTSPLVAKTGDRVRIRFGNLSMSAHPIHLHGYHFHVTGGDGGPIPASAQWPMATVQVPVGATRDIEFIADEPGDWVIHCHKSHHTMNAMGHGLPNTLGVDQRGLEEKIRALLPGYMAMGERGMAEMQDHSRHMTGPENTLPMMGGEGPFGNIEMGGMFTLLKVRDRLESYEEDPGWYEHPPGTVAYRVGEPEESEEAAPGEHQHHG
jgi:manganese oxidase